MLYDFDTPVTRIGTDCEKWDKLAEVFGRSDLLPFWVADMDFKSAPEIIDTLRERVDAGVFGYPIMADSAKESVSNWLKTRHGWSVGPETVNFTPGVISGLSAAVYAFSDPGDGIAIQTPVYPQFFKLIKLNGREVVENPLKETDDGYVIDYENLRESLGHNVKILLLSNPHNPVARVWRADELSRLADICIEREVVVLSDEIHQDLVFSDAKHLPLGLVAPQLAPFLITFVAPSKTFNIAGLSASAWVATDKKITERFKRVLAGLHIAEVNMLAIAALETAYRKCAPWLDQLMVYLEKNRELVETFLRDRLPRVKLKHPEGSFIFWLDFRDYGLNNAELQRLLIEDARVALSPGINFGAAGDGFARLNTGCPRAQLEECLKRIEKALSSSSGVQI
ncbi:MAG: PatB family C-S lyase [Synergistaceae bacterium]|jgi:cystathionine beta-lyase|nr:PatB family C-S lyase [Synergistaceae bacterium]